MFRFSHQVMNQMERGRFFGEVWRAYTTCVYISSVELLGLCTAICAFSFSCQALRYPMMIVVLFSDWSIVWTTHDDRKYQSGDCR